MQGNKIHCTESHVPSPVPYWPPRFDVEKEADEWLYYLDENGYVVLSGVIETQEEIRHGKDLAWRFLEGLGTGIKRDDPSTWGSGRWPRGSEGKGIIASHGAGQSEFMWFLRGLPKVKSVFAKIWRTEDLAVSFDGFSIFRPPEFNPSYATSPGLWYHLDQNGIKKQKKLCIQGQVTLMDASEKDGGLVVVPASHKIFNEIFKNRPELGRLKDFVNLYKGGPGTVWENEVKRNDLHPVKLCTLAGDLILWDSRLIHCNTGAQITSPPNKETAEANGSVFDIRRLSGFVCMTPLSRLTPEIIDKRRKVVLEGKTTSHWPEDCIIHPCGHSEGYNQVPSLSPFQKALIPM